MSSRASTPPPPSISPPPSHYSFSHASTPTVASLSRAHRNRSASSFSSYTTAASATSALYSPGFSLSPVSARSQRGSATNALHSAVLSAKANQSAGLLLWECGAELSDVAVRVFCREESESDADRTLRDEKTEVLVAELKLHSTILQQSEFFAARLSGRWKENSESSSSQAVIVYPTLDSRADAEAFVATMNLMYSNAFEAHLKSQVKAVRILRICNEILWHAGIDECCRYIAREAAKEGVPSRHQGRNRDENVGNDGFTRKDTLRVMTALEETFPLCDFSGVRNWFDSGFVDGNFFSVEDLAKLLIKSSGKGGELYSEFVSLEFSENEGLNLQSANGNALVLAFQYLEHNEFDVVSFVSKSVNLFRWTDRVTPHYQVVILDSWINKCWDLLTIEDDSDLENDRGSPVLEFLTEGRRPAPIVTTFMEPSVVVTDFSHPRAELNSNWIQNQIKDIPSTSATSPTIPPSRIISPVESVFNNQTIQSPFPKFGSQYNSKIFDTSSILGLPEDEDENEVLNLIPGSTPKNYTVSQADDDQYQDADEETIQQDVKQVVNQITEDSKGKLSLSNKKSKSPSNDSKVDVFSPNVKNECQFCNESKCMHEKAPHIGLNFQQSSSTTLINEIPSIPRSTSPENPKIHYNSNTTISSGIPENFENEYGSRRSSPMAAQIGLSHCFSIVLRLLSELARKKILDDFLDTKNTTKEKQKQHPQPRDDRPSDDSDPRRPNRRNSGVTPQQPAVRGTREQQQREQNESHIQLSTTNHRARSLSSSGGSRVVRFATTRRREEDDNVAREIAERRMRRREQLEADDRSTQPPLPLPPNDVSTGRRQRHVVVFDDEEIIPPASSTDSSESDMSGGEEELNEENTHLESSDDSHISGDLFASPPSTTVYTPDILDFQMRYNLPKSSRLIINLFVCLFQIMRVTRFNVAAADADVLVAAIVRNVLSMRFRRFLVALLLVHSDVVVGTWTRAAVADAMRLEKWRVKRN
ncbi:hypothetical protein HK096_008674 [Nowakowskiella sp. JEL0078]|nr:hypothetical protein HK096_008674 [Nowakowskiella sp. JEL0078]